MSPMDQVFKAYDVRGTVPYQLNADMCRAIGRAVARFAGVPELWCCTCVPQVRLHRSGSRPAAR